MVSMATKTNGSIVTLYEKWLFFQLKIRKLTIRTIYIDLIENIWIDELFLKCLWVQVFIKIEMIRGIKD